MAKLPQTQARLAISIKIYAVNTDLDWSDPLKIDSFLINISKGTAAGITPIAGVTRLDEANTRNAVPRYEIDADKPGEIVERIPQLVDRTLTLERVVLYSADALKAIGNIDGADLIEQTKPFSIVKVEYQPDPNNPSGKTPQSVTMFTGCWFTSNPKSYNLGGNIHIIQACNVAYAKRFYIKV
ncbi:MAG: hypothetical protein QXL51_00475 [Candidatus Aenigmatarchaeota archaeon]